MSSQYFPSHFSQLFLVVNNGFTVSCHSGLYFPLEFSFVRDT